MATRLTLWRELFTQQPRTLLENSDFTVTAFRYLSGVEAVRLDNARGHLVVLPGLDR